MFFHVLSFSTIFVHLLFYFSFIHFYLSFIFFHVSFIFFFFVGCSKSDFLGINFVTISIDSSYVKKQFLGPSQVVPLWVLFSFFSYFFFLPFFFFVVFCLVFFHFFSFFVHFFIFGLFNVHFFLKKKVSSFLFSCISFKYVLLLALVSEFNCFLRSRWCP